MAQAALLSLVTASIAFTVSETALFAPVRGWVNGRSSSSYRLIYTLMATAAGAAEVPAQEVRVGSRTLRTQALRLQIAADQSGRTPVQPSRPGQPRPRSTCSTTETQMRQGDRV